ncbi:MAG: DUF4115 domain-containing protein [Azoarcus sp.]|jgi:cytoskeleton protein RodZ|nr:DUF4115 domain-containing protein [Azoarcus sp.]
MQSQSDSVMGDNLEFEDVLEPVPSTFEQTSLDPEAATSEPGMSPAASGEILRKAREERGESLNDIARTLKISTHQLEALENGRYDILPGPTFARGFLRNYARYLGISPEPLLESISARTPTAADLTSMLKLDGNVQPAASPRPPSKVLPVVLIALAALALAGLVGFGIHKNWFKFQFNLFAASPAHEKTVQLKPVVIKLDQPVPVNIAPESAKDPLADGQEPLAGMPSAPEVATLRLLFNASTWVDVRDNTGKLLFNRTGVKGSSNSVKGNPPLTVRIKHANNVNLEFNGQAVDLKKHTNREGFTRLTLQ